MITWEKDLPRALARGKAEQKGVLLEFYSPDCIGCKRMENTLAELEVNNFITDRLVALQLPITLTAHAAEYTVTWTPTMLMLDYYGREHLRSVGFLPPEELVPWMLLGQAKIGLDTGQYNEAVIHLNTLLNGYPESSVAPEAVFLRGVSRFKSSHQPQNLKDAYLQLQKEYPASLWLKKAEPYQLL